MKLPHRERRELLELIESQEQAAWNALYGCHLTGLRVSPRRTDAASPPNGPVAELLHGGGTGRWEGSE